MRTHMLVIPCLCAMVIAGCGSETPTGVVPLNALPTPARVENGVSIAAAGVGLVAQPAEFTIVVDVADQSEILEAWFYWSGRANVNVGDDTIEINGVEYVGNLAASYPVNGGSRFTFFYKMDALGLIEPGENTFNVDGFDLGTPELINGIGLAVVYEDTASECTEIQIIEPFEFLYHNAELLT